MNILYIAASCAPNNGSEDKIGWNVPIESAKENRVFVLTMEKQRGRIEEYLVTHPMDNPRFYFVDIPRLFGVLFKGPLVSGQLNIWHKRAFKVAVEICNKEKIDIIHQITPIEFRSIGEYGRIPTTNFVCGPLGGGEKIPEGLKSYARRHKCIEFVRMLANEWSRIRLKRSKTLERCAYLMFANRETRDYLLERIKPACQSEFASDVGLRTDELCRMEDICTKSGDASGCRFLVVGRMVYRKGLDFLLDALVEISPDLQYQCRIVGSGAELEHLRNRCAASERLSRHVVLSGAIPYDEIEGAYRNADVFIMPSIRETTGTVVVEAMSKGLPVIALNQFGAATILDQEAGWLCDGTTKDEYIESLKNAIEACIMNPDEVRRKGENARRRAENYSWEKKYKQYHSIYRRILKG